MTSNTKSIPDWAGDMARVPYNPMQDRAAFGFSTGGPCGMIPADYSKPVSSSPPPISGFARRETPIAPPPGVALCDKLMDAADAKDKAELVRQSAATADVGVIEVATKMVELLTQQQQMMVMAMNASSGQAEKKTERSHGRRKRRDAAAPSRT